MSSLIDLRRVIAHSGITDPSLIEIVVADAYGDLYTTTAIHREGNQLVITIEENVTPITRVEMPVVDGKVEATLLVHDDEQTLFESVGVPDPTYDFRTTEDPLTERPKSGIVHWIGDQAPLNRHPDDTGIGS